MPIYEFTCTECGNDAELLVSGTDYKVVCQSCGSDQMKKKLSVPSSLSGVTKSSPATNAGPACCGMNPGEAGCAGPGSCCGKTF